MTYAEFDELLARVSDLQFDSIAARVVAEHEPDVADLPTWEQLAPLYETTS